MIQLIQINYLKVTNPMIYPIYLHFKLFFIYFIIYLLIDMFITLDISKFKKMFLRQIFFSIKNIKKSSLLTHYPSLYLIQFLTHLH